MLGSLPSTVPLLGWYWSEGLTRQISSCAPKRRHAISHVGGTACNQAHTKKAETFPTAFVFLIQPPGVTIPAPPPCLTCPHHCATTAQSLSSTSTSAESLMGSPEHIRGKRTDHQVTSSHPPVDPRPIPRLQDDDGLHGFRNRQRGRDRDQVVTQWDQRHGRRKGAMTAGAMLA